MCGLQKLHISVGDVNIDGRNFDLIVHMHCYHYLTFTNSVTTSDEEFDEESFTKLQERHHLNKDDTSMAD